MTWAWLAAIRARPEKRIAGLISGTSADGITAAVVSVADGGDAPWRGRLGSRRRQQAGADRGPEIAGVRLLAATTQPYPDEVRRRLLTLFTDPVTTQSLASIHYLLGELFADAARAAADRAGGGLDAVDFIASHGQTVAHVGVPNPGDPWARAATLQIGEAAVIAERTGRPVVADFRAADIAAGGQAAPLVPYADLILFGGGDGRVALNLGGISNLTVLPAGAGRGPAHDAGREAVFAFDCGPANMLADGLVRWATRGAETFDRDGARAARGTVHPGLLASLLAHPFVTAPPPKTAGHEQFGRPFLEQLLTQWGQVPPDDLIATATAFAADAVAANITRFVLPAHAIREVVASGGGTRNPVLMERLAASLAPVPVRRSDDLGVPSDAKEAIAFALLGHASLWGIPGNLPRVTGARHPAILGTWTWPPVRSARS